MVNLGPSRGCETCKRRRKKCDETRPSCLRCVTANRTCGGYDNDALSTFRQHDTTSSITRDPAQPTPAQSIARRCTLPVRIPSPTTGALPPDGLPAEVSDERVEEFALRSFFYDWCIPSTNRALSRGYLSGLESMVANLGWQSDLAKACKIVACATHGKKLRRPALLHKGDTMACELLQSLRERIKSEYGAVSDEAAMVAVLLGLHEIIMADESPTGHRNAHARGVAAILQIAPSTPDFFGAIRIAQSQHPLVLNTTIKTHGLFPTPYSKNASQSLDALLFLLDHLWKSVNTALQDPSSSNHDFPRLIHDTQNLEQAFASWQNSQVSDFRPWEVGYISQRPNPSVDEIPGVGLWPGRVDMYFDLSVAGVWNICRTARLLLIDLTQKLLSNPNIHDPLNSSYTTSTSNDLNTNSAALVQDIISSVPFHLAEDIHLFIREVSKANTPQSGSPAAAYPSPASSINLNPLDPMFPGRRAGGLFLMHPLCIAANLDIVPQAQRSYFRNCLGWIASYMGIGIAEFFGEANGIDKELFADSRLVIWAGMLV